jgi:hypothetical protein
MASFNLANKVHRVHNLDAPVGLHFSAERNG